jgi:hypothetical protein
MTARGKLLVGDRATLSVSGDGSVLRSTDDETLSRCAFDLVARNLDKKATVEGTIELSQLSASHLEELLARPPGTISDWIGEQGELLIGLRPRADDQPQWIDVRIGLDRAAAELEVALYEDSIEVRARPFSTTLGGAALTSILFPTKPDRPAPARISADFPVTVSVSRLDVPLGMLTDRPLDPSAFACDLEIAGGPLALTYADSAVMVGDLRISVRCRDLADRIDISVAGRAGLPSATEDKDETGEIDVQAVLTNLIGPDSRVQANQARLAMAFKARRLPTVVPDSLVGMNGLLVAAVGPTLDAAVDSFDFSPRSGRLSGRITTQGSLVEGVLEGRDGVLVTRADEAIRCELEGTPALGEQLLTYIHPVLGDICSAANPVKATVSHARIPLDGDLSRFDADVRIEIGQVELDAGSSILAPLKLFGDVLAATTSKENVPASECVRTVPGAVEPIDARIRSGVVTYESFTINVGKHRLKYAGSIDLVNRSLDIQTEVPVSALGGRFSNLPLVPAGIALPVHTLGPFDNLTTSVKIDRLIGNIPDAVFGNLLRKKE